MPKLWIFAKQTLIIPFIRDKFAGKDIEVSYKDTDHWDFSDRHYEDIVVVIPGPEISLRQSKNEETANYVIRILYDGEEVGVLSEMARFPIGDKEAESGARNIALAKLASELKEAVHKVVADL